MACLPLQMGHTTFFACSHDLRIIVESLLQLKHVISTFFNLISGGAGCSIIDVKQKQSGEFADRQFVSETVFLRLLLK